ncbi:MAG: alpha/beta hydrolase [Solobacterium sp.]|nr:alpha/beta hydrolase [Solobacterium sp.]
MKCDVIKMNEEGTSLLYTYILDPEISFGVKRKWPAMIVVPGGGYLITATKEGEAVASQFLARGFSCFVLRYSTYLKSREELLKQNPGFDENAHYPAQQLQLMEVIHLIKEHAEEWNIDTDAVYACGFSAGGHVIASVAAHWNDSVFTEQLSFKPEKDELKLNGCVLGYPMVVGNLRPYMEKTKDMPGNILSQIDMIETCLYRHTDPTEEEYEKLTIKNYVTEDTSPMFIWHTTEDIVVSCEGTLELVKTLHKNNVPCEYHLFGHGPHGLACANRYYAKNKQEIDEEIALWLPLAENWLKRMMENENEKRRSDNL